MRGRPVERCENAGERPCEARHVVGDDRQAEAREAGRIAVGVEDEAVALRRETLKGALQNRAPGDGL